jgi:hypothetical protein
MTFLKKKKTILGVVVLILVLAVASIFIKLDLAAQLRIGVGWKAQILCSGVFVSGRDAAPVLKEDVAVHPILKFIGTKVDYEKKEVRASFLGLIKNRSVYRHPLGSILLSGASEETVRSWPVDIPEPQPANPQSAPWPTGDLILDSAVPPGIDGSLLDKVVNEAFAEPDPENPRRTRAVVIVHKGRLCRPAAA